MSLRFEWMVSLWLRPDTPADYLTELRYHLGIIAERPTTLELGDDRIFQYGGDSDLPGGTVASLKFAQPYSSRPAAWGLHMRTLVPDDTMYELLTLVPPWLGRWSATQGWVGFAREESGLDIWLNFYTANGHAYVASPGEQPMPVTDYTQPFPARKQTTVDL